MSTKVRTIRFSTLKGKGFKIHARIINKKTLLEKRLSSRRKRAPYVSYVQVPPCPDCNITRLYKSKRESTAPPNELDGKLSIAIKSLRYHSCLNKGSGGKQPFVRNYFSHDILARGDSIRQLYLPPIALLSSRDQESRKLRKQPNLYHQW